MYETEPAIDSVATEARDKNLTQETAEAAPGEAAQSNAVGSPSVAQPQSKTQPDASEDLSAPLEAENPPVKDDAAQPAAPDAAHTIPLARLQGVQRQLSQAEKDRDSYRAATETLQQQLAAANARAASEYAERIKSTQRDIVPDLIQGETIEQVDASLAASRAAFAAARQAYARTIPTPTPGTPGTVGNPSAPQQAAQPTGSAVQLISQGLRQPSTDINH